ncbi:hypothetical protein AAF712_011966 [Marasmius tenuissimus]|uniref:Pyranose 2-oxidase n=1 Tax=Marasmius tenuissimus TaxID=585030 RepID=A0ABR2ZJ11_9AGAR
MPSRLKETEILEFAKAHRSGHLKANTDDRVHVCDVFIAGSGPIAATYARKILDWAKANNKEPKIIMAEIGSQDGKIIGGHHKNSVKYQKDIDMFVNVIKGALQPVSIPPSSAFMPTMAGTSWRPPPDGASNRLIIQGHNPDQVPEFNLGAAAVTRTVGGMGTHWTCSCPIPHDEERVEIHKVIPKSRLDDLLQQSGKLLNVHEHEYDHSIRQNLVKKALQNAMDTEFRGRDFHPIPLAVERRKDNPEYVTWSSASTVLGEWGNADKFTLLTETRVTRVGQFDNKIPQADVPMDYVLIRDLNTDKDKVVFAKTIVLACGALPTPQILWNSCIRPPNLGCYLTEQSMAFCQVIMNKSLVDSVDPKDPRVIAHKKKHPEDPLPIPFNDPEPQFMIPYSSQFPWHVQVHRDAFSYGDVGPKADPRVVVDLRFFGKGEIKKENKILIGPSALPREDSWEAGVTDIYGMPQVTFHLERTEDDNARDQRMMKDMTTIANYIGSYLPGSNPQYMEPGLALHITGTLRIGNDPETSIADAHSKVHRFPNLWVGGNGCLPDATGSNPTRTSAAVAIQGAEALIEHLKDKI